MKTKNPRMLFALLLVTLTLAACSGGGGGTAAPVATGQAGFGDPYHGILVPPEPDPSLNKATLLGVDSNGNGVRDDVERIIAAQYGTNFNRYDAAMRFAKSNQEYLLANGDVAKSTAATSHAAIVGACMYDKYAGDAIQVEKVIDYLFPIIFNTPERMKAYSATSKSSTEVSTDLPDDPCK